MLRNKIYYDSKVLGKYNIVLDGTRFQKSNKEVSSEWLYETIENEKTWYLSMLEMKLVASLGHLIVILNVKIYINN